MRLCVSLIENSNKENHTFRLNCVSFVRITRPQNAITLADIICKRSFRAAYCLPQMLLKCLKINVAAVIPALKEYTSIFLLKFDPSYMD